MSLINHYSILWGFAFILALSAYFLLRGERSARKLAALTLIGVALVGAWFAIRPKSGSTESADALRAVIGQGTPVFVELQSPY
jgi:hypothetical protein